MGSCACPDSVFASVHWLVDAVYNLQLTMTQTQLHSVSKSNLYLYLSFLCVRAIVFVFAHMLCDALYNL